jgi:hypothetical protein
LPIHLLRIAKTSVMAKPLSVSGIVERKYEQFSRFVCIPLTKVAPWKLEATTTVEGTINGTDIGRRSLKRGDDRKCWWIDLPEPLCKKAGVETGDRVELQLQIASEDLPQELSELIAKDPKAKSRWLKLTSGQKRMLREDVMSAKQSSTRARRAARELAD